ncbi:GntR family transcriptional regulator [Tessaracoccus antarcticus]|uniref:GntR family transcriptional regulator n=1 Tax=Tessaracoccus antarcticus TaxID=2479848 RepID=UPI001F2616B2|nr:GntR family transcriptional regulator [Tessaracoccus antarcticus]
MSLRVRVDTFDPTPPYEQLRRQLEELISTGGLVDGQRLPSVRQLAADLSLAAGTVARTYAELEKGGLVVSRRGAGTRVTAPTTLLKGGTREERLMQLVHEVVGHAVALGMSPESLAATVEQAMHAQEPQQGTSRPPQSVS